MNGAVPTDPDFIGFIVVATLASVAFTGNWVLTELFWRPMLDSRKTQAPTTDTR